MVPRAIDPDRPGLLKRLGERFANQPSPRVIWLTDGIDDGQAKAFAEGLLRLGTGGASVEAIVPDQSALPLALAAPGFEGGRIKVTALRVPGGPDTCRTRDRTGGQWPELRRGRTEIRRWRIQSRGRDRASGGTAQ